MKHKGIVTLLLLAIMTITVAVCEDGRGMEHTDDNGIKCVVVLKKIKIKDKKKYHKG